MHEVRGSVLNAQRKGGSVSPVADTVGVVRHRGTAPPPHRRDAHPGRGDPPGRPYRVPAVISRSRDAM
jgi:hypothetical protein